MSSKYDPNSIFEGSEYLYTWNPHHGITDIRAFRIAGPKIMVDPSLKDRILKLEVRNVGRDERFNVDLNLPLVIINPSVDTSIKARKSIPKTQGRFNIEDLDIITGPVRDIGIIEGNNDDKLRPHNLEVSGRLIRVAEEPIGTNPGIAIPGMTVLKGKIPFSYCDFKDNSQGVSLFSDVRTVVKSFRILFDGIVGDGDYLSEDAKMFTMVYKEKGTNQLRIRTVDVAGDKHLDEDFFELGTDTISKLTVDRETDNVVIVAFSFSNKRSAYIYRVTIGDKLEPTTESIMALPVAY